MALFNFGKKKEEERTPVCSCSGNCAASEGASACGNKVQGEISCIKVLGSGCKNCHDLLENTKKAVQSMGITVEIEYVTDMQKIMEYGVMSMPALIVNEKVVSMGKILKTADIVGLLYH